MTVLIMRHYGFQLETTLSEYEGILPAGLNYDQWMGVYLKGEKIGYSHRETRRWDSGYKISETVKMRLKVMGIEKDMETVTDAYLDSNLRLKSFDFILKSDINMNIRGQIEGKNLTVSIEAGGLMSQETIQISDKSQLNFSIIPEILQHGLKAGTRLKLPIIDPTTLSEEQMDIEIIGKESIMAMGRKQDTFKLRGSFKGIELFIWLTEKGEVLREESPMEVTLIKETEQDAIQIGKPSIDLIAQVAIPFSIKLPSDASYLKVRLSGVDLKGLELDGGRQSLKGDIIEIRKESFESGVRSWESRVSDEYLKDTMFIQSKDPEIISLAKRIVGDERDTLKATQLLYEWVYKNIEKTPTISIPMATEVLRTMRGDCNEHTTLFVSLSRASRIPARIAIGLAYKDGYFYYHAWPEVYLERWVAIDPTLGQFPADTAHIRLLTGDIDKQVQLLPVIGRLKIEGIEYR